MESIITQGARQEVQIDYPTREASSVQQLSGTENHQPH